jgi:hypothetical protein
MNWTWGACGRRSACGPNEFGLQGPSANGRPAPTGEVSFASAKADARRGAPWEADFNWREGLRPTVGLRRPGRCLLRRRRPTPGAERLRRPISNRRESLRRPGGVFCVGEGRRPARSASEGRFPIGVKACADRGGVFCVGGADAWRAAPWKADFDRRGSLRRPGRCLLRRRRPTPGAQRPERLISIGVKAFGRRSACVPNEFGLPGPSAGGRPAPTEKRSLRRRSRRLARSALEGRFQSA